MMDQSPDKIVRKFKTGFKAAMKDMHRETYRHEKGQIAMGFSVTQGKFTIQHVSSKTRIESNTKIEVNRRDCIDVFKYNDHQVKKAYDKKGKVINGKYLFATIDKKTCEPVFKSRKTHTKLEIIEKVITGDLKHLDYAMEDSLGVSVIDDAIKAIKVKYETCRLTRP